MPAADGGAVSRTAVAQPRTPPAALGMVLFLASELMFFGGLFAAYFTLRSQTPVWPPAGIELELPLTVAATVLLTLSSFTMSAVTGRTRRDRTGHARRWIVVTFLLGAAFLVIKVYELSTAGFGISSHAYGSLFFTMLGAHGVHLLVGLALLVVLFARLRDEEGRIGAGEAVGYYWHFVDVVWLAIFATVYVIR